MVSLVLNLKHWVKENKHVIAIIGTHYYYGL